LPLVRFQVLTASSMKMVVFWAVAPCSLVEVYRRFRGACWSTSETSENFYQTTRRSNSEDSYLPLPLTSNGSGTRGFVPTTVRIYLRVYTTSQLRRPTLWWMWW
jgi:hypothetical protein